MFTGVEARGAGAADSIPGAPSHLRAAQTGLGQTVAAGASWLRCHYGRLVRHLLHKDDGWHDYDSFELRCPGRCARYSSPCEVSSALFVDEFLDETDHAIAVVMPGGFGG